MADMMTFPDTWEEFEKRYGFDDSEELYTNGSRLIPSFRVKQWLDHIAQFKSKRQATVSSDCVSRQAAFDEISKQQTYKMFEGEDTVYFDANDVGSVLVSLPSAQPEIIHCRDCKHHWTHRCMDSMPTEICDLNQTFYDPNIDFCSLAERRTDE